MSRERPSPSSRSQGFTLIEVMVALMVVAMGLSAMMITVSSTARSSGYLRDKTLAQWIAMNRLTEVRLNLNKFSQNTDTGEVNFGNRTWHYDTRYFDTSFATMKRVVVRVYAGDAKTKGYPIAESIGFLGTALGTHGGSNVDWSAGTTVPNAGSPGNSGNPNNAINPNPNGSNNTLPPNPVPQ